MSVKVTTKWSDLYLCRVKTVPEDVRAFFEEKAEYYEKSGFGYAEKDYRSPKAIQIEANSTSDEETILNLINNDSNFINNVNLLLDNAMKLNIFEDYKNQGKNRCIQGNYAANRKVKNHDAMEHITYDKKESSIDFFRYKEINRYSRDAVWGVESKTTNAPDSKPCETHRADLVLRHVLGTKLVQVFLPTVATFGERTDKCYEYIGAVTAEADWRNIRVDYNWNISKWEIN